MHIRAMGLLTGWKRATSTNHIVLTLKVAETAEEYAADRPGRVHIAIDDWQLCSLARDLARAARERGLEVWPSPGPVRRHFLRLTLWRSTGGSAARQSIHALLPPSPASSITKITELQHESA